MSKKIPALKPKKILKVLLEAGFFIYHQKGSHIQLRNSFNRKLRVTIPYHNQFDLPPAVVHSILKQADILKDDFLKMLKQK